MALMEYRDDCISATCEEIIETKHTNAASNRDNYDISILKTSADDNEIGKNKDKTLLSVSTLSEETKKTKKLYQRRLHESDIILCHVGEFYSFIITLFSEFCDKSLHFDTDGEFLRLIIEKETVKIYFTTSWSVDAPVDVCLIGHGWRPLSKDFCENVKSSLSKCPQKPFPFVPVFIAYNVDEKFNPEILRDAELAGERLMNRKIGNQLANDVGAVKYIEFSAKSGRGVKTMLDEIALAGRTYSKITKRHARKFRIFKMLLKPGQITLIKIIIKKRNKSKCSRNQESQPSSGKIFEKTNIASSKLAKRMEYELVTINSFDRGICELFLLYAPEYYYVCNEFNCFKKSTPKDGFEVDIEIIEKNVKLIVYWDRSDVVSVVGDFVPLDGFYSAKAQVVECRQRFPNSFIFVVGNYLWENRFLWFGRPLAEATAKPAATRKVGNQQSRDLGAAKFIEWPAKSERDCRVICVEISFSCIVNKDKEDENEKDQTKRKR